MSQMESVEPQNESTSSDKRQTQSYLRGLFDQHGLQPKNKLGQNFLIDLNMIDFVMRGAELGRQDLVLEVGTGTGSLTAKLALRRQRPERRDRPFLSSPRRRNPWREVSTCPSLSGATFCRTRTI